MRVALVHFLVNRSKDDDKILAILKKASEGRGNEVVLVDGLDNKTSTHLGMFDYIAVLIRPISALSTKVPESVLKTLAASGTLSGKKGCALVLKVGLRSAKTCRNLMHILESQGLRLDYFDIVKGEQHAADVGANIG